MSAESAVLAGRAAAEALMVDACKIERRGAGTTTDPGTGKVTPLYDLVYAGKCRVQARALATQSQEAGDFDFAVSQLELQVPMSVVGVRDGDVATVTASVLDPDLVGRRLRVTVPAHKTHATSRRFPCTEGGTDG